MVARRRGPGVATVERPGCPLSIDPYLPPNDAAGSPRPKWLQRAWNALLFGVFLFFCVLTYPALRHYTGALSPQSTTSAWAIASCDVCFLLHRLSAVALFLLTLGTFFNVNRGYFWRCAFVCVSLLFVIDPYQLRPTRDGIISAVIYSLMVVPILVFGLGWPALAKAAFLKIYRGRTAGSI